MGATIGLGPVAGEGAAAGLRALRAFQSAGLLCRCACRDRTSAVESCSLRQSVKCQMSNASARLLFFSRFSLVLVAVLLPSLGLRLSGMRTCDRKRPPTLWCVFGVLEPFIAGAWLPWHSGRRLANLHFRPASRCRLSQCSSLFGTRGMNEITCGDAVEAVRLSALRRTRLFFSTDALASRLGGRGSRVPRQVEQS